VEELDHVLGPLHEGVVDLLRGQKTAPIGMTPFVRPLAQVIMSGITSKWSAAKGDPSRPKPVMTSSKIRRMPCFVQISRSA
jgi:hypothetical protein